jgi:hypothetical protein
LNSPYTQGSPLFKLYHEDEDKDDEADEPIEPQSHQTENDMMDEILLTELLLSTASVLQHNKIIGEARQ